MNLLKEPLTNFLNPKMNMATAPSKIRRKDITNVGNEDLKSKGNKV